MARIASLLVLMGPFSMLALGCGPSVQSIYEGNVRFEHCYRLDIDPHIAPTHREACWREWKETYTYGQTRDRVEYASRRIRALASGDVRRPVLEANPDKIRQRPDVAPSEAPIPTSLHAPPPSVAPVAKKTDGGLPDASVEPEEPDHPDEDCTAKCDDQWQDCAETCSPPAGTAADGGKRGKPDKNARKAEAARKKKCRTCRGDYRKCMRRCFR